MSELEETPQVEESTSEQPQPPKILFGFGVFVTDKGNLFIERNKEIFKIPVEREATLIEIRRYVTEIIMDLQAQAAAEYTVVKLNGARPDPVKE